jgi:hypothetical protein
MTSKEFVLWLQGFTQGVHEHNITPKQWDALKDVLAKVNDEPTLTFPINTPNTAPNTHSFPTWQHPHYVDPNNPFTVNGNPVSFGTTTPGTTGFITVTNPNLVSFGSGSSTSTTIWNPSGSAWHYTNNTYNPPYTTGGEADYITKETHNED